MKFCDIIVMKYEYENMMHFPKKLVFYIIDIKSNNLFAHHCNHWQAPHYVVRKLDVSHKKEGTSRVVIHIQVSTW